jgi:hypothetical protein
MPLDISLFPMRVLIDGHDTEGSLVLADNQLAAVFVRLMGRTMTLSTRGGGIWKPGLANAMCSTGTCSRLLTRPELGLSKS